VAKALASDADLDAAFALSDAHKSGAVDEAKFVALVALVQRGDVAGLGKVPFFETSAARSKRHAHFQQQLRDEQTADKDQTPDFFMSEVKDEGRDVSLL
jgi:hypothetical protein